MLGEEHPSTLETIDNLAALYLELGRAEDALPLQRELLGSQVAPADAASASAEVLDDAAWTLLTIDYERLRDPERALGFAKRACALVEEPRSDQLWAYLDTLALAQHRTGDTAAAIETQKRAVALMPEGADPEVAQRLAEYEAAVKKR